jgi:hypothetical protein
MNSNPGASIQGASGISIFEFSDQALFIHDF